MVELRSYTATCAIFNMIRNVALHWSSWKILYLWLFTSVGVKTSTKVFYHVILLFYYYGFLWSALVIFFPCRKESIYFIFNKMNSKHLQILYVRHFRFQYRPNVDKKYFYRYLHIGMFDYLAELLEYHLHTPSIINVLK